MILVSIGHNPYKKGARYGDFFEFDEASRWVPLIVNALGSKGMAVPAGKLPDKVDFINAHQPELAIECHFNSFQQWKDLNHDGKMTEDEMFHTGKGCETLYYPGSAKGKKLAMIVQESLSQIFFPDRGVREGYYRENPNNPPDYFLAKTHCPAVIIEPDFIHRKDIIQQNRDAACQAIAGALLTALEELKNA